MLGSCPDTKANRDLSIRPWCPIKAPGVFRFVLFMSPIQLRDQAR